MGSIGAVILAAGGSSRFGQPKQLIQFRGKSLVRRMVNGAGDAGCSPVIVVIGSHREQISRELADASANIVENENWQCGIGSSIRAGVRHLIGIAPNLEAIVLLVCDQPSVESETVKRLIGLREETKKAIVASSYADTLGVPALFDRSCFEELLVLDDASGAKPVILSNHDRVAEFPFPAGRIDIDTAADLELARRAQRASR